MKSFDNTNEISVFMNYTIEKVLDYITEQTLKQVHKEVVNKAYINTSQSGEISDLFGRDYVLYFEGTGTPTFQFLESFTWIRNNAKVHMATLFYDEDLVDYGGHDTTEMDNNELFDYLNDGKNGNQGDFVNGILDWITDNFERMVVEGFSLYGLDLTKG